MTSFLPSMIHLACSTIGDKAGGTGTTGHVNGKRLPRFLVVLYMVEGPNHHLLVFVMFLSGGFADLDTTEEKLG